ncbi:MAG: ferrochelatase [Gammaproteobacteria bacterium]|nr:ferrochelatase [Gammaproteobacteria bacterium]
MSEPRFGIIMVHLGTPEAPTAAAVRAYLAEFLADPRVIDLPRAIWLPILYGLVLPFRPRRVARLYASVWQAGGSPLRVIAERQRDALDAALKAQGVPAEVALAMTYGRPGINQAWSEFKRKGIKRVLVLPMYPQYSATTTAAVFDALARALRREPALPELRFLGDWHAHPAYIAALAASVRRERAQRPFERLLMSFHGIPKRYVEQGDCYVAKCQATAAALAEALELKDGEWALSFQSRFGKAEWVQPYSDKLLAEWARAGVKRVAAICPGFSADCLETLEEIAVQNREGFEQAGGEVLRYIPALNDEPVHIALLAQLVRDNAGGW